MKKLFVVILFSALSLSWAFSQSPIKIYTSPKLPARDALERMNLTVAWNRRVTVDGQRDGVFSVQLIPGSPNQLVVQTYKGGVFLFDADQGDLIWKTWVGIPYWAPQPAAWNSQCIFVTRRNVLHVINRATGDQRVWSFLSGEKSAMFGFQLQFVPSAAPVADEEFLYVCMASRLHSIYIPDFEGIDRAKRAAEKFEKGMPKKENGKELDDLPKELKPPLFYEEPATKKSIDSPQPFVYWAFRLADQVTDFPAMYSGEQISMLSTDGSLVSVNRYDEGARVEQFEFKTTGRTPGGPGQHGAMAYLGSDDFNLYAVNMKGGSLAWRYVSGAPILRKPDVNDDSIFISPERVGLRKIDRIGGREVWTNRDAQRFLATNNTYVYALDNVGKFFVLDARRGTTMASYDLSDWRITVANEYTDRIYLAANDGQILCLRHRDLVKPLVMKVVDPSKPKFIKKEEKKEEEKKEEKKEEEKKEEKKEEKAAREFRGVGADSLIDLDARTVERSPQQSFVVSKRAVQRTRGRVRTVTSMGEGAGILPTGDT